MSYLLHLAIFFCIYAILTISLNLILRFCGYLSLAHAAYFALGAYTYALLTLKFRWLFLPVVLVAATLGAVFSLLLSLATWRLKGDFFVMISLAVQTLMFTTIFNWASPTDPIGSWKNLTNGSYGLPGIPRPDIFGVKFDTNGRVLLLSILMLTIITLVYYVLIRSPWGRAVMAIRDDELAARNLGKNARSLKVQTFGIACAMAAIGGALFASYAGFIDPNLAVLDQSILILCMALIGGSRPLVGPLLGAGIIILLPQLLRMMPLPTFIDAANLRVLVYGLLLVATAHFGFTISGLRHQRIESDEAQSR
jgi:branched-chain amino acid transport system permease protein